MKLKLFALLAASFTMVASGQETKEKAPTGDMPKGGGGCDIIGNAGASKVAKSIASVVQKFDGKKYAPTKIAGNPDYYIMYFTASW